MYIMYMRFHDLSATLHQLFIFLTPETHVSVQLKQQWSQERDENALGSFPARLGTSSERGLSITSVFDTLMAYGTWMIVSNVSSISLSSISCFNPR